MIEGERERESDIDTHMITNHLPAGRHILEACGFPVTVPLIQIMNLWAPSHAQSYVLFFLAMVIHGEFCWATMWLKQCHKLPMTGNGKHATYLMVIWGGVYGIV
jgi:hypothetical protein